MTDRFSLTAHDRALRRIGRELFAGAWDWFVWRLFWIVLVLLAFTLLTGGFDYDDTDGHSTRSGMHLRTDYGTGCQYLESSEGGITPRLGRDGKQVCR